MLKKIKNNWILVSLLGIGISLLVYQYLNRIGCWGDEIMSVWNFKNFSFKELSKPLNYWQVHPLFFVYVEKILFLISEHWSFDIDLTLKIYPLLCAVGTLFFVYPVILKLTNSKFIALMSLLLLELNPIFIYYSSEIKHYICELFYAFLTIYFWLNLKDKYSWKRQIVFVLSCFLSIVNSFSIFLIFLTIGLYDGFYIIRKKKKFTNVSLKENFWIYIITYSVIFLFLLSYYLCFFYNHTTMDFMNEYWFVQKNQNLDAIFYDMKYKYIHLKLLFIFIFVLLSIKNKFLFMLAFISVGVHYLLGYFEIYPVATRFLLYWLVFLPVIFSYFLYYLLKLIPKKLKKYHFDFFICLCFVYEIFIWEKLPYYYISHYLSYQIKYLENYYEKEDYFVFKDLYHSELVNVYSKKIPEKSVDVSMDYLKMDEQLNFIKSLNLSVADNVFIYKNFSDVISPLFILYNDKYRNKKRIWFVRNLIDENRMMDIFIRLIKAKKSKRNVKFCKYVPHGTVCLIE